MAWASQQEIEDKFHVETIHPQACPECGSDPGECYYICSRSLHFYSPEREREDALFHDSLSQSEWFSLAVRQYEQVHGEPYVS